MNKKIHLFIIIFSLVLIGLIVGLENHKESISYFDYDSLCVNDNEFIGIINEKKESSSSLLKNLSFNDNELFFDEKDSHFYYSLIENDASSYNPKLSWKNNNVNIAFKEVQIDENIIKNNVQIELLAYNDKEYYLYKLTCTTLPLMNIQVFNTIGYNDTKTTATLFDNRENVDERTVDYKGTICLRGGSTIDFPKGGFKLELDPSKKADNDKETKRYQLLDLQENNTFVLYAGYNEADRVRNVFSMNLWYESCSLDNSFNIKTGMYYRYVELFVNHEYWGLYALGFQINNNLNLVDKNNINENLYKMNIDAAKELYDLDKYDNLYGYIKLLTHKKNSQSFDSIKKHFNTILYSNDNNDLYKIIDLDNALDMYLFLNLIQGWDNIWTEDGNEKFRNMYLVSKQDDDGNIRMLYVPWDLDLTWGNYPITSPLNDIGYLRNYIPTMIPINMLLENGDNNIKTLLLNKYNKLRGNEWSNDKLFNMIDEFEKNIHGSGAYLRDIIRWPESDYKESDNLNEFKEYVEARLIYFDGYITDLLS